MKIKITKLSEKSTTETCIHSVMVETSIPSQSTARPTLGGLF